MNAPKLCRSSVEIVLAASVLACFAILSAIAVWHRPAVGYDASMGLLTWQSMERGAHFNQLRMASKIDLAADASIYWAAHTPGQYLLPAMVSRWFGAPIGTGLTILQIFGIASGILGYYLLYIQTFAFSRKVALLASLVILLRVETVRQFLEYSGGGLLLFAATPWFLMCSWACLKKRGVYLTLLPFIFLAGAFLKLSFALIALSLIGASMLRGFLSRRQQTRPQLILNWAIDLLSFLVFYAILYLLHTSKGFTASHASIGRNALETGLVLCYSLSSILSNAVSIFDTAARFGAPFSILWNQPYTLLPLLHAVPLRWLIVMAGLAAVVLLIVRLVWARVTNEDYRLMLLGLVVVHVVVLTSLFLGTELVPQDRHFWPASAILLPGIIAIVLNIRSVQWRAFLTVLFCIQLASALWSVKSVLKWQALAGESQSLGLSFAGASQGLVNKIEQLDAAPAGGRKVFFFRDPPLALLIQKSTRLVHSESLESPLIHADKLDRLYVILPEAIVREKTPGGIESLFPTAKTWQVTSAGSQVILCAGCDASELTAIDASGPNSADTAPRNPRLLAVLDSLNSTPLRIQRPVASLGRWFERQFR